MEIKKTQNINFKGTLKFARQADAQNALLRFPINYLKYHCGAKNVEHQITLNEASNYLMVYTDYVPELSVCGVSSFRFLKKLDLCSNKQFIEQAREINKWLKRMKKFN